MKPLYKIYLLLISLCVALASCHKDEPKPKETVFDNTVLVYFPWSISLTNELAKNITDIKHAIKNEGGTGQTRVFVFEATGKNSGNLSELAMNDGTCQRTTIEEYTEWEYTDTDYIRRMLNTVVRLSPTETYSMVVGCHGSGWLPKEFSPSRAFGGATYQTDTNIEQLAEAIATSNIKHLEYLYFDDCYMANIELAYELRHATNYVIGSTSEVMGVGTPYADVWRYMQSKTPNYKAVVDGFTGFYTTYTDPYGALSVIDCRQTETLASLMHTINTMTGEEGANINTDHIQRLDGYRPTIFYDMKDYTDALLASVHADEALKTAFNKAYSDVVVAHNCTPLLCSYLKGKDEFEVRTNCGLTISDPTTNAKATQYVRNTSWWQATHR